MDELVKVRVDRGISQRDVARIMGVSQPRVCQFEASGSNPRLSTIRRYAMAVGALIRHTVELTMGNCSMGVGRLSYSRSAQPSGHDRPAHCMSWRRAFTTPAPPAFPTPDGIDGDGGPVVAREDLRWPPERKAILR